MPSLDTKLTIVKVARVITYLVYFWILLSLIILVLGFFLLLFGANPTSSFVEWAYRNLDRVMEPFRGIFTPIELNGQAVLDTSVVFAMIVYSIIAMVVRALIDWLTHRMLRLDRAIAAEEAQHRADELAATQTPYWETAPQPAPAPAAADDTTPPSAAVLPATPTAAPPDTTPPPTSPPTT